MKSSTEQFRIARDFLLEHREDYAGANHGFEWPRPENFNFATDWFDAVLATEHPGRPALRIIEADGTEMHYSFAELASRSNKVANWLRAQGVKREMRVLLLLGNQVELWETTLAVMKLGAVLIPASTMLTPADLGDRVQRGDVSMVIARSEITQQFTDVPGNYVRVVVGEPVAGWLHYADTAESSNLFERDGETKADDPLLLYFTSGTTSLPKLVEHTHTSYPIGHLSTMYWIGLRPGDVHLNLSSPGWAKHAWSCVFAPWIAGATICIFNYERFDAGELLKVLRDAEVTTFCAPPTVWRMLIQQDLSACKTSLREVVSAGEPLNPEVIASVQRQWGLTIRDGYGQTETTLQILNAPGQTIKLGSMGKEAPGFRIDLVDLITGEIADEGEICVRCEPQRPVGLMAGYQGDDERNTQVFSGGRYHTGDVASRDSDGFITYIGRTDDVFKASDYRISPFELESVLIEHFAVAEAAVVPATDGLRLAVPKAYVSLVADQVPSKELAGDILQYCRQHLASYKRIRRMEFANLPKTVSGKIRRVELRSVEIDHAGNRPEGEYREEDFS